MRAWLCLAVLAIADGWLWAKKEGPLKVVEEPIDAGRPVLVRDIEAFETRCFKVGTPRDVRVFRAVASVVALAGSPSMSGGWQPTRPATNSSETGYETMDQVVANTDDKSEFLICLTTFSSQGCDSILTVLLISAQEAAPQVQLRPNFPSVWPFGPERANMTFLVEVGVMEDMRITAVPVNGGSVDVQVYPSHNSSGCIGRPQEVSGRGAAIVPLSSGFTSGFSRLCIVVQGVGDVLLVAGPHLPGPFLVPAIPLAGRLKNFCETARIWVNNGTDVTVTASADDASTLILSGMLTADVQQAPSQWKGQVAPGGGAVLVIEGKKLADAKLFHGIADKEEVAVSLSICRRLPGDGTRYWITSVTDTGVVTLQDGLPAYASVPSGTATWREFRLLMSTGKVTVVATSHGTVWMVADTKRSPNPAAFRWEASRNSSRAVLRLTTDPNLASSEIHLVDCRLPCFLYLAAYAFVRGDEADVPFTVVATSSGSSRVKQLVQGLELEQDLDPHETQVYAYSLPRNDTAVVFTVTRHHGKASFRVSSSPDFPEGPRTTARADAVILLEPSSTVFMSAVQGEHRSSGPVLYVEVVSGGTSSSSLICARSEGHAKWLLSGVPTEGAVKAGRYDRHRFFISPAEAHENVTVTVDVSLYRGQAVTVFAACDPNQYPWEQHHDWAGYISGQGNLVFNSSSPLFKSGWIYLSITSDELAAYSLRVKWDGAAIQLKDGVPEKSMVPTGAVRWFSFSTSHLVADDPRSIALRAHASVGAIGLCVREYRQISGLAQLVERLGKGLRHRKMSWMEELSCVYSTSATSLASAEESIAALDLPAGASGASIEFGVLGRYTSEDASTKSDSSEFSVMAVAGDVVVLPEVQTVIIDSLAPGCCVKGSLRRSYRRFLRVPSGSLELRVRPLGSGTLSPETKFSLRAGAALPENSWFQTVQPTKEGILRMSLELKDLVGSEIHRGFWVEAQLEVPESLNYTLSFQHELPQNEAKILGTFLPANVPVPSNLTQAEFANFTFQPAKAGSSRLCLRQCFGQVELQVESAGNGSDVAPKEDDLWQRGNCTAVVGRADGAVSSALVKRLSETPSSFEIELAVPRAEERIQLVNPVLNFSDFKLCDEAKSCQFSITVSFTSASIGLASSGLASEPQLRYEVMAMDAGDPDLHPDTSCGLQAALEHQRAISKTAVQAARYSWQHQLQGVLDFEDVDLANRSIVVNVLASLVLPQGQIYAVTGYEAVAVVPASLRTKVKMDYTPAYMVAVVALIFLLMMLSKGRRNKGDARSVPELEMTYDLHEEGERSLLEQPGHGGYVPPSV